MSCCTARKAGSLITRAQPMTYEPRISISMYHTRWEARPNTFLRHRNSCAPSFIFYASCFSCSCSCCCCCCSFQIVAFYVVTLPVCREKVSAVLHRLDLVQHAGDTTALPKMYPQVCSSSFAGQLRGLGFGAGVRRRRGRIGAAADSSCCTGAAVQIVRHVRKSMLSCRGAIRHAVTCRTCCAGHSDCVLLQVAIVCKMHRVWQ